MKQVKIGEKIRKSSLDKSYDEKENEILTPIISETITAIQNGIATTKKTERFIINILMIMINT